MIHLTCREITEQDISHVAEIRANKNASITHWSTRVKNYLAGIVNPQGAQEERVIYVAVHNDEIIGFVAGHLSTRFGCEGELQWIDTKTEFRRMGVASQLVVHLAHWFISHKAYKVCVDPGSQIARQFYKRGQAEMLNEHWMFWNDIRVIV